ncbi:MULTISPECIES: hypothetical protein [Streptomyces]|uniref:hypothetical protein n=1 Tax=Streptomyces TaxID=1883 RepID=UPI0029B5A032|nr:hypothetical protein [Streptomyces stelliscabiei]MDX2520589.1 hypothetical protein [Streptomyces stelliscabiei]MDX2552686.1 hypothetical protein [Streptomyces stelliscabiei]MDX2661370.1 hypothetical protein [Streptomyces stelliscabiei]MDX2788851.1 hypothetical protein [Streptomyces stelliscabiei]
MPQIKVLEAIAGADFSWAPGDIVDVTDEEAASWADGHRAALLDSGHDRQGDGGQGRPSVVFEQPVVFGEDGQALEVLAATLEPISPPAGQEDGPGWVRWSVTVRLPLLPALPGQEEDGQGDHEKTGPEKEDGPVAPAVFDPREHTNREVLAYLETVDYEEALRVLDVEANDGENRAGIGKNREQLLAAARTRGGGTEKAADASRGGGRGEQPETREW